MEEERILTSKLLPNGIRVTFYDLSRNVAADRWLIKVKFEADFEASDGLFASVEDRELAVAMRREEGERVQHVLFRERNFIDAREKDNVLQELYTQLYGNVMSYMGKESFQLKLFHKKVEAFRLKYLMQQAIDRQEALTEDEGPADFSACFKD